MEITKEQAKAIASHGKTVEVFATSAYDPRTQEHDVAVLQVECSGRTLAMYAEDGFDVWNA